MRIQLQITDTTGQASTFEHAGPVIHVGRDPACELALPPDVAGVSRQHARIELATGTATVADAGSSNGTLHNGQLLSAPAKLRVGDQVQLGYTGPVLKVVALDVAAPVPAATVLMPAPSLPVTRSNSMVYIGVGVGVGAVLLAGILFLIFHHGSSNPVDSTAPEATPLAKASPSNPDNPAAAQQPAVPLSKPQTIPQQDPIANPPPAPNQNSKPPTDPAPADATTEVKVGYHVVNDGWGPSVLLARRGEEYPWDTLWAGAPVSTAQGLMSLPGYRSEIALDSKVQLTLWGTVPQFGAFPPLLLESVALLRAPEPNYDADVILDWGRIKLANRKEQGPARVRLRFGHEVWDVTLKDKDSEVAAELWSRLPRFGADPTKSSPLILGLFNKGAVILERTAPEHVQYELPDHTQISWSSQQPSNLYRRPLTRLPAWWNQAPDVKDDRVAAVMLALKDWAVQLNKPGDLIETIQATVDKSDDPAFREQGMYMLAALDAATTLVPYLEDSKHATVRRAAAHALRCWLNHGGTRSAKLRGYLEVQVKRPQKAALVMTLLHGYSEADLKKPETYQHLIDMLNDDHIVVRELASWQLEDLAPQIASAIPYNPASPAAELQQAVSQWHQRLPAGQLPPQTR